MPHAEHDERDGEARRPFGVRVREVVHENGRREVGKRLQGVGVGPLGPGSEVAEEGFLCPRGVGVELLAELLDPSAARASVREVTLMISPSTGMIQLR